MKPFHLLMSIGILVTACSSPSQVQENTTAILPPLKHVKIPENQFSFPAEKPYKISFQNGSEISIPESAFVDENGKTVEGEVSISYQEFHSLTDIFLSGIPMEYDSGGVVHNFKSAGMFTIKGFANGKPIFIADGKNIDVKMASEVSDEDGTYNFYELDESTGKWSYESTVKSEITESYPKELIPEKIDKPTGNELIIELNLSLDGKSSKEFKNCTWLYDGPIEDTSTINALLEKTWSDVSLTKKEDKLYSYDLLLTSSNSSNVKATIPVKPLLFGKNREEALANIEANVNGLKQKLILANTPPPAPFSRWVSIDGFGTYNYDIIFKDPDRKKLLAKFTFEKEVNLNNLTVVLICAGQNMVINYNSNNWDKFSYNPHFDNILIAVLPNDEIAYMDANTFQDVHSYDGHEYEFKMKIHDGKIKNKEDLENLIKTI